MRQTELIEVLEIAMAELDGMLGRFKNTHSGLYIDQNDEPRFKEMYLTLKDLFYDELVDSKRHINPLTAAYVDGVGYTDSVSFHGVESVKGVVAATLARVRRNSAALISETPTAVVPRPQDGAPIKAIADRLHAIIRQLRRRHAQRSTLNVADEYDLQDLFHALLMISFRDIRQEEWTPSYAGTSSRMDFFLPEIASVIELKMTRPNLSDKEVVNQLTIDIARYRKHPDCKTLYCVIYDPEGRIQNPRSLETDLSESGRAMAVKVIVVAG